MERRELHATIGVEVLGAATSTADMETLRGALDERHLLLLRGGVLEPQAQLAFVARFGPIIPERNLWSYVSNVRPDGIGRRVARGERRVAARSLRVAV